MSRQRCRASWATLLWLAAACSGCAPTCGNHDGGAPPTADAAVDARELVMGDAALRSKLAAALAAKGPDYRPRTKHLDAAGKPQYTNRLILETSPYLLQHAHNPVSWFPWGDEAFALAKQLGRPVFLSIGYSTCHWCHVMEEESFEDEAIARYLNDHYIAIKVDREERPDVDGIYMQAVQLLTGRGGWPMSVWLTPERKPFYGGTYFPAHDGDRGIAKGFSTLLEEQQQAFTKDPDHVAEDAAALAKRVADDLALPAASGLPPPGTVAKAVEIAAKRYDAEHGGPEGRPKFPSNFPLRLLLRVAARSGDARARRMALHTLDAMQAGGIYDQVGGGFHRYSTDERWLVPHFEKMLYDNALLAMAYLEGLQLSGRSEYRRVAREILDYVVREMTAPDGGYDSATDADSLDPKGERVEGYYFTWTPTELETVLGPERARVLARYYDVSAAGQLEGRSILHTPSSRADVAKALSLSPAELDEHIEAGRAALRAARAKRPKPLLDDKVVVSNNGLMISAMARGSRVLGEPRYLASALRAAQLLLAKLMDGGRLHHSFRAGRASGLAFAEDYAFLAAGLLDLFEASQQPRWLAQAIALMEALEKHHAGPAGGYFRAPADGETLLAREMEMRDGAVPAAASVAAMVQLRLYALTTDERWRTRAEQTLKAFASRLEQAPWTLDDMMLALESHGDVAKEIALITPADGDEAARNEALEALRAELKKRLLPSHVLVITSEKPAPALTKLVPWAADKPAKGGKVTAYVCERGACELPTSDPAVFAKQLAKTTPYPVADPSGGR